MGESDVLIFYRGCYCITMGVGYEDRVCYVNRTYG